MAEQNAFDPPVGVAEDLGRGVRRILAPNPSPMTFRGTNTYLLGDRDIAVIDPGPLNEAHLEAILGSVGQGQRISHILVTHAHLDHSPLAEVLGRATGAPVLAYGGPDAGRSTVMQALTETGLVGGGEGVDAGFYPDEVLADGDLVETDGWTLRAHWTPGHFGNHMCFEVGDMLFTGDLVMGWASSMVSPPDGDLTDFMASCRRMRALGAEVMHAGHGAPIENPAARLDWLIAHRESREADILRALEAGAATAPDLAETIYTETPPALMPAATRNVLAHLIDLAGKNHVHSLDRLSRDSRFELTCRGP
jgi:glyoxylase-like metal-dependent hydrolase (beta-lactamase superfamily II)